VRWEEVVAVEEERFSYLLDKLLLMLVLYQYLVEQEA
jgi:hypothetical protein